jgi:ornithine decarboxylase
VQLASRKILQQQFNKMNSNMIQQFTQEFNLEKSIIETNRVLNDSFYVCNLSDLIRKFEDWQKHLPRVKPCYAVKCNDDMNVLKTLASLGSSFDCASLWEIEKILSLNVDANRIIFANTTKPSKHIEYASKHNVRFLTFDNEDEIAKIVNIYPSAK